MPLIPVRPLALALGRSTYTPLRYAHAARVEEDDSSTSSPSHSHSQRHPHSHSHSHSHAHSAHSQRKGKQRANDYEFPKKGKSGGPPDPFEILGLERSASGAEIKSQYYKLALMLHPDSAHPSASTTNFATLHKAYTLLSSPGSRQAYLANGLGWNSASSDGTPSSDPMYDSMVAEVLRRKAAGAGQRHSRAGSDAGRGAWGAYGMDGKWHEFPGAGVGGHEPTYMSHSRFLTIIFGIAVVAWMAQYKRFDAESSTRREADYAHHLDASHALATAREEARLHGHARREQMRRRVNEARMREAEQQAKAQEAAQVKTDPRPLPPPSQSHNEIVPVESVAE